MMKKYLVVITLVILLLGLYIYSGGCTSSLVKLQTMKKSENVPLVFTNVTVIPMDTERIVGSQTVIIQNGIIQKIGIHQDIPVPTHATVIDGTGKYLMPGLTDMHTHINNPKDLVLFLAHGVTTVQNMWGYEGGRFKFMGFPDHRKLRRQIREGIVLGPTIYTSGSILEGEPLTHPFMKKVTTPEQGVREVVRQTEKGYDFIKVYDYLNIDTYQAIVDAAKERNIPVKGHVPFAVGIDGVLASGQISIDHLNGYLNPDSAQFLIPKDALDEYARKTREAGIWNCATIVIWQKRGVDAETMKILEQHPGNKYLSFIQHAFLNMSIKALQESITYEGNYPERMADIMYRMVKALHDAGAGLLIGTDCGNPFVFPGWSVHEELQYFVNAGLTPYDAIAAGTKNAAEYLNILDQVGTVETGKRADLILVDGNPLDDVANASKISGVVVRGLWLSKAEIDRMLEKLR